MDKQILLEKMSNNNVEVSRRSRRNVDEYVTIVSHRLNVGEYKFECEGPDGMTSGKVTIDQVEVLNINTCKFVKLDLPILKNVSQKIQYAVSTYTISDDDVLWCDVDSSGPPFKWLVTVFFSKLLIKIITKKETTAIGQSPLNDLDIYNNKEFSDVTLRCRNAIFECHKVFLATRSPVFKAEMKTRQDYDYKKNT